MSDVNTETKVEAVEDPVEQAAILFHEYSQQFRKLGYGLANRKKRAAIRVLEAVLFEPLEEVKLEGKEEQQLFKICQHILANKVTIMNYAISKAEKNKQGVTNESEEK